MKTIIVRLDDLHIEPALARPRYPKVFEEHLRASIDAIGLVEPIKVTRAPNQRLIVIDGVLRVRAMQAIRAAMPHRFDTVEAYEYPFSQRFEIRYQSDIYQDLLPSQLASLVEHLHETAAISKAEIARYIGVSPPTLRNYTGVWRMMRRGSDFAVAVELMDLGVFPSSNPYAWLRLTDRGAKEAFKRLAGRTPVEDWLELLKDRARRGNARRFSLSEIESATSGLPAYCYRERADMRDTKRRLGLRRRARSDKKTSTDHTIAQLEQLTRSASEVAKTAAQSMLELLE